MTLIWMALMGIGTPLGLGPASGFTLSYPHGQQQVSHNNCDFVLTLVKKTIEDVEGLLCTHSYVQNKPIGY